MLRLQMVPDWYLFLDFKFECGKYRLAFFKFHSTVSKDN